MREEPSPKDRHHLWEELQAFALDRPGVAFPFSARLARENGWTPAFARRVIDEYRRFLFLSQVAGHPVTPSVAVDQAWHLHLTYSRSYWEELCGRILGRPLHHDPTEGGTAEGEKFHDWYAATLESYARVFGTPPPPDVWPAPQVRFARNHRIHQVSEATHWIVRKPRRPAPLLLGLSVVLTAAAGCGALELGGASVSPPMLLFVICVLGVLLWWLWKSGGGRGSGCAAGCTVAGGSGRSGDSGNGGDSGCAGDAGCGGCGGCGD